MPKHIAECEAYILASLEHPTSLIRVQNALHMYKMYLPVLYEEYRLWKNRPYEKPLHIDAKRLRQASQRLLAKRMVSKNSRQEDEHVVNIGKLLRKRLHIYRDTTTLLETALRRLGLDTSDDSDTETEDETDDE